MKSSESPSQPEVRGGDKKGVRPRKLVPQEPRIAEGLWFFTEPREGGWAAHLPSPASGLPTHQHSRMFWFAFDPAPSLGNQTAQQGFLLHTNPQGPTSKLGTKTS